LHSTAANAGAKQSEREVQSSRNGREIQLKWRHCPARVIHVGRNKVAQSAAGEYVSVSSQADTERADIERERKELATDNKHEHEELAAVYVKRGLNQSLAKQVAEQLMAHDALATHTRGELGAFAGGAPLLRSVLRVTFWGALAMALTAGVGALFGAAL
jgi:VIT1/CCC1 family predicted Fe2+/Mn2+ transporter